MADKSTPATPAKAAPKPRKRKLSEAQLAQRRANQPKATAAAQGLQTGPKTEAGKAASSRNNWKHGRSSAINRAQFRLGATSMAKLFGKPCQTTCPFHPDNPDRDEAPCSLVLDGMTRAGQSCLDRTVYANAITAIMDAITDGDMDGMNGLLATQLAASVQMLDEIRLQISQHGVMVAVPMVTKDGDVLIDPSTKTDENPAGSPYVADWRANPLLPHLTRLTESLGINFAEVLATPASRAKQRDTDDAAETIAQVIGAVMQRAQRRGLPAGG